MILSAVLFVVGLSLGLLLRDYYPASKKSDKHKLIAAWIGHTNRL